MQQFFFIRTNGRHIKINFEEIIYVEGSKNYLKIITEIKTYINYFPKVDFCNKVQNG